jgi:hypothetical protein
MKRREFIAGLGSAAAWPVVVRAQQAAVPVIGLLSFQSAEVDSKVIAVRFFQGLREIGYVEGQNVAAPRVVAVLWGVRNSRLTHTLRTPTCRLVGSERGPD